MKLKHRLAFALVVTASLGAAIAAAEPQPDYQTIAHMDLEELLHQQVTTVMRKEQTLSQSPSAVYVVTAEDIRRSGATSIPEALRLVPGVTVLRTAANGWVVTARGFDNKGATKLQVLIDGRSVYSLFFEGVFWDIQDTVLEDIDRIEVIRGPGAVTWGENAVNGVINILTKRADATQGFLASGLAGSRERGTGSVRYGGKFGDETYYRVFGKYAARDQFDLQDGTGAGDKNTSRRGGFRIDSQLDSTRTLTVQGDGYSSTFFQPASQLESYTPPFMQSVNNRTSSHGADLLARYTEDFSEVSKLAVQAYYDYTDREDFVSGERRHTFDLDAQHQIRLGARHDLVYGLEYRLTRDRLGESVAATWVQPRKTDQFLTAFAQDEISLIPRTLSIIPGTKLGYNDFSGFEYQPALKAIWKPDEQRSVWASVSRAVRIPSRFDSDLDYTAAVSETPQGAVATRLVGSHDLTSEKVLAYELGYRAQPLDSFSYDLAAFYHDYDELLSFETGAPFPENSPAPAHVVVPLVFDNGYHGQTYGVEVATTWRPADFATIAATYSLAQVHYVPDSWSADTFNSAVGRRTPRHQATLRGHFNLPRNFEFDALLYFTDATPALKLPSYIRGDLRLGYKISDQLALDVIGQNLLDPRHAEYRQFPQIEVPRAVVARITYRIP